MANIKQLTIALFITGLGSCDRHPKTDIALKTNQVKSTVAKGTDRAIHKNDHSKYYAITDSIKIITETIGTVKYDRNEFNRIIDEHPEFFTDLWQDPDKKYYRYGNTKEFGSEVGQDSYFVLYAYFLKQKNGTTKHAFRRKKLIEIYSDINSLFAHFQYGGTYFGHQCARILGYAEYSVYLYSEHSDNIEKTYDITKQKKLYIQSLRQLLVDESNIDHETLGKEKTERNNGLHKIIDNLERLITDNFYLRRAQEFQYGHYDYY
jgi:hypothetical protein